jgi:hypothetical protein
MDTPIFKIKVQERINELDTKQEIIGKSIGMPNKGNFSKRLSDASKFTLDEITKLSEKLKFNDEEKLIINTELFCNEKFKEFLSTENVKECKIIKLKKIIKDNEDEPMDRLSLSFAAFFSGIITTLLIQFLS